MRQTGFAARGRKAGNIMPEIILVDNVPLDSDLEILGRKLKSRSVKMEKPLRDLAEEARPIACPRAAARLSGLTPRNKEDQIRLGGSFGTGPPHTYALN